MTTAKEIFQWVPILRGVALVIVTAAVMLGAWAYNSGRSSANVDNALLTQREVEIVNLKAEIIGLKAEVAGMKLVIARLETYTDKTFAEFGKDLTAAKDRSTENGKSLAVIQVDITWIKEALKKNDSTVGMK